MSHKHLQVFTLKASEKTDYNKSVNKWQCGETKRDLERVFQTNGETLLQYVAVICADKPLGKVNSHNIMRIHLP